MTCLRCKLSQHGLCPANQTGTGCSCWADNHGEMASFVRHPQWWRMDGTRYTPNGIVETGRLHR